MKYNKKINRKRGAEAVENILMIAIVLSLIVAIFYPQLTELMNTTFDTMQVWFKNALNQLVH